MSKNRKHKKVKYKYKEGDPCSICKSPLIWSYVDNRWKLVCPTPENHLSVEDRAEYKRFHALNEVNSVICKNSNILNYEKEYIKYKNKCEKLEDDNLKNKELINLLKKEVERLSALVDNIINR